MCETFFICANLSRQRSAEVQSVKIEKICAIREICESLISWQKTFKRDNKKGGLIVESTLISIVVI